MTDLKKQVGQKIKKLRAVKGITQEKLAETAGISVDFLSLIERGRNAPSLESIEKIAKALGVPVKEIFD
jgi:transcriptional regulator with XRE-family HTH domain